MDHFTTLYGKNRKTIKNINMVLYYHVALMLLYIKDVSRKLQCQNYIYDIYFIMCVKQKVNVNVILNFKISDEIDKGTNYIEMLTW